MTGLTILDGVRVVDFTQALSGPYCTLMLADLGADVVKVENPDGGDDSRHWGPPFVGDDAAYFVAVNRNKRSIALDLKSSSGIRTAKQLAASADVVVENWRPGTASRLGLGAAELRATTPSLVYCSISGFGQDQGSRSGYDQIVQGTSGVMTVTGPAGSPTKWGVPVGDIASGMFAATAIIGALLERVRTGRGRTIDIAMQDSLIAMLTHHAARYLATGVVPESDQNGHPTIAPYGTFRTADGFVNICVGNDAQFMRLCQALGRSDLLADERFSTNPLRLTHKSMLLSELERTLLATSSVSVLAALEHAGVPAGNISDIGEVLDGEHASRRDMILPFRRDGMESGRVVNTPWKFDGIAPDIHTPPPLLGEHSHAVLDELHDLGRAGMSREGAES
jgi:formyl-CoA transferase